jgi:malonate-semialdehyde dehydrogenase (acetylating)/methylmalonate-semialdehyde dehydrogenase
VIRSAEFPFKSSNQENFVNIESAANSPHVGDWINGGAVHIGASQYINLFNPSSGEVIAQVPVNDASVVDRAVQSASAAFATWSRVPVLQRGKILFSYRELLTRHSEDLVQLICEENGKTFEEAKGDVARGIEVVEFATGVPHLLKGERLSELASNIDAETIRQPLGVCAGITPFNFPAMVPMWMYPLAIACGNSFVLKPSEKTPLTANRLAELFSQAGLPDGVFNIVHGQKEVVDALCVHPDVSAVSFVGSSHVAEHVYKLAAAHKKRVQASGGAKNVLLVMPDANLESATRAIIGSAFGCAGQRCMAGSLLIAVGNVAQPLRDRVVAAMDQLLLDDTLKNRQAGMGPVIDMRSRDRLLAIIDEAGGQPVELVRDGREQLPERGYFVGPTLFDHVPPGDKLATTELFGPLLSMMRADSLHEAVEWVNSLKYGNGATIFTGSGAAARQFCNDIQCGMVGVNVGVPAPMAVFPFSGWNDSFYGDLHVQGEEGVQFYTRQKVVLSRWDSQYIRQMGW